jgi:kanamycin kinase
MELGGPIPDRVLTIAVGQPLRPVWHNQLGGLTYQIGTGLYVKWSPHGSGIDLAREAERLAWAAPFTPVPVVLDCDLDDDGEWLVTAALPGEMAVTDRWKADACTAVVAIAEGLREMHDAIPVDACPFSWALSDRVAQAQASRAAGDLDGAPWHADASTTGCSTN